MTVFRSVMLASAATALALATAGASAQTLQVATDQSPVGLDRHVATAFSTTLITGPIYEGLTATDSGLQVIPALAESWTVSEDGLTYVFTLRDGVTFHDGSALDAADVVATFTRVQDEATGSPLASRINMVENVEATGDNEVTLTLSTPAAALLSELTTVVIVPSEVADGSSDVDLQRQPVGTGPFQFGEWVPDTYIELTAFADYWDSELPLVEAVRFNIVPEASTRQVGLSTGTYDMLPNIDSATAVTLQATPNVTLLQTADLAYSLIGMNVAEAPFDDPAVRAAVNMGINRDQLVEAVYFGQAEPGGPLSPALEEWALSVAEFSCYGGDPAAAQQMLAEAGYTDPVAFTINVLGSLQTVVDAAQVVQAQLNEAGFDVTLNVQEQGTFVQDWRNSNFQAFASLNGGRTDPDGYLYRTFHSGGSTNVFNYADAQVDEWLEAGRSEVDPSEREAIYAQLQEKLACEGPIAHLAYGDLYTATTEGVEGYEVVGDRSTRYLRQTSVAQ